MGGNQTVNEGDRCSSCGASLRPGASFCTDCGSPSARPTDDTGAAQAHDAPTQVDPPSEYPSTPPGPPEAQRDPQVPEFARHAAHPNGSQECTPLKRQGSLRLTDTHRRPILTLCRQLGIRGLGPATQDKPADIRPSHRVMRIVLAAIPYPRRRTRPE